MLSNLTNEQFEKAMRAFLTALPEGTAVHAMRLTPKVGFGDASAGGVAALVLADSEEDFRRFQQVIDCGMSTVQGEYGLLAAMERQDQSLDRKA